MVVSQNTAEQVLTAIEKYMTDKKKIVNLLNDLSEITGNQSYINTIDLLRKQYRMQLKAAIQREI